MKKISSTSLLLSAIFILLMLSACGSNEEQKPAAGPENPYARLFPEPGITGFDLSLSPLKTYDSDSIFTYLDGGAELFLEYGLLAVTSGEYDHGSSGVSIETAVYDMATPENAFGIYSYSRYPESDYIEMGNEAIKTANSLEFWKGQYYVKLISSVKSEFAEELMLSIGGLIADSIKNAGSEPPIMKMLPQDNMLPKSGKFFEGSIGLNGIHFIDDKDILKVNDNAIGAAGKYSDGDSFYTGFLIQYEDQGIADSAFAAYKELLNKKGSQTEKSGVVINKINEQEYTLFIEDDKYIAGVWDLKDVKGGEDFINKIKAIIEKKL